MIGYIRGELLEKWDRGCLILTSGGVGYVLHVATPVVNDLPAKGGEISLYVHTVVREDALELYGFATFDDRSVFESLIGVTKLGPKTALSILSFFTADELREVTARGDVEALTRVPGIGKKSAQRIFVELQYKLEARSASAPEFATKGAGGGVFRDALAGLTNLGYSEAEAGHALRRVFEAEPDLDVSQALRQSLKLLASEKT
jgi:holliday junction DNA helicase RuvA